MSTKTTDTDWANVLEVFRACLPRRGRKATDDRLFLEAMHFFTVENLRWRALPERFGHWNSVWKRFDRLRGCLKKNGSIPHRCGSSHV
ncbi:transposase [Ochrobactrum intermedium]|uniref:Transposase n=1 Tax=Brucella intermedia TaxID=94625 RepID=A0ABR6AVM1_9HYPH|nr:transposase [Brucella intermedia]